jgi:Smg protein
MFEVLEFVYDTYGSGTQCPTLPTLHRKLNALGFGADGILNALVWLEDLQGLTHDRSNPLPQATRQAAYTSMEPPPSCRVLTAAELRKLGSAGWGLLTTLASAGLLPWNRMELVLDRAMATPGQTLALDQLKLIVLMVFWSLNEPAEGGLAETLLEPSTAHLVH